MLLDFHYPINYFLSSLSLFQILYNCKKSLISVTICFQSCSIVSGLIGLLILSRTCRHIPNDLTIKLHMWNACHTRCIQLENPLPYSSTIQPFMSKIHFQGKYLIFNPEIKDDSPSVCDNLCHLKESWGLNMQILVKLPSVHSAWILETVTRGPYLRYTRQNICKHAS